MAGKRGRPYRSRKQVARKHSRVNLLDLPTEVRLIIWSYAYASPYTYAYTPHQARTVEDLEKSAKDQIAKHSVTVLLRLFQINRVLREEIVCFFLRRLELRLDARLPSEHAVRILNIFGYPKLYSLRKLTIVGIRFISDFDAPVERLTPTSKSICIGRGDAHTIKVAGDLIRQTGCVEDLAIYGRRWSREEQEVRWIRPTDLCLLDSFKGFPRIGNFKFSNTMLYEREAAGAEHVFAADKKLLRHLEGAVVNGTPIEGADRTVEERSDLINHLEGLGISAVVRHKRRPKA